MRLDALSGATYYACVSPGAGVSDSVLSNNEAVHRLANPVLLPMITLRYMAP